MRRRSVAALAVAAALLCAPREGAACWDEYLTEVDGVSIHIGERARLTCGKGDVPCSTWGVRLAAILPKGARLDIRSGIDTMENYDAPAEYELCLPHRRCHVIATQREQIAGVFRDVATRLQISGARRAQALRLKPASYTLQIGAFSSAKAAADFAYAIDSQQGVGMEYTQGHPGPAISTSVEEHVTRDGTRVFRVMGGVMPGYRYAVRERARLATITGDRPVIRRTRTLGPLRPNRPL